MVSFRYKEEHIMNKQIFKAAFFLMLLPIISYASSNDIVLTTADIIQEGTSATIHKRGSGTELRFSKNRSAMFKVNSLGTSYHQLTLTYSSKKYTPQLTIKTELTQLNVKALPTKGHGNFTSYKVFEQILLKPGVNHIHIESLSHNFYLRNIRLKELSSSIIHSIPKTIKSWENSYKSPNVYKAARGSSYETRFGKGGEVNYSINNLEEDAKYDVNVTYSSKNTTPKLDLRVNGMNFSHEDIEPTNGHGSSKTKLLLKGLVLKKGISELTLKSLGHNFYLKNIKFTKAETPQPEKITTVPGNISVVAFSSNSKNIQIANRGSSKEVRLKNGQTIEYFIENKEEDPVDFQLDIQYSSARTTPKIDISINDLEIETNSIEKTNSHGDFLTRTLTKTFQLAPGIHKLNIKSRANNLYFKKLKLAVPVIKKLIPLYQVNAGGNNTGSWFGDKGRNNEITFTDLDTKQSFYTFGNATSKELDLSNADIYFDNSVPRELNLDIFKSARQDRLDEQHSTPGVFYEFKVPKGNYQLNLHLVTTPGATQLRLKSNAKLNKEILNLAGEEKFTAKTIEIGIEHDADEELQIEILPLSRDVTVLLAGLEVLVSDDTPENHNEIPNRYIVSPKGTGNKSGTSPSNSRPFKDINTLIGRLSSTGGEILLLSNKGIYRISSSINIRNGGASEDRPVIVKTFRENNESTKAIFKGTRQTPWINNSNNTGNEFLRLMSGANNLKFEDIQFEDFGNGIFRIGQPISNLTLSKIRSKNFTRLVENYKSGSVSHASVVRLKLENIEALGYTRGVIRLKYNSKNIKINNLLGDSEQQLDQSSFPMGIALDDYVSNVNISNSLLKNHRQQRSSSSSYFNGDGIATESKVDDVNIVDTISSGNSDGGFDLKSTNTNLLRTIASNNKRNYRFWNPASLSSVTSLNPQKFGGGGNKVHFGAYGSRSFNVTIEGVNVIDTDSNSRVFSVGENKNSRIIINSGVIQTNENPDLRDSHTRVEFSPEIIFKGNNP